LRSTQESKKKKKKKKSTKFAWVCGMKIPTEILLPTIPHFFPNPSLQPI
jgi:hypothetical protein